MTAWQILLTSVATNEVVAELPPQHLNFTLAVNAASRAQARFSMEDPRLNRYGMDLHQVTDPTRTALWILYQGVPVWGGFVLTRTYQKAEGTLEVTANSWSWYWSSRFQAQDYTYTWMAPADPLVILSTIVEQAMVLPQSLLNWQGGNSPAFGIPYHLNIQGQTPLIYWITASYPSIQLQTVGMIAQTLSQMGYGVGPDWADVALPASTSTVPSGLQAATILANPYVGRTPTQSPLRLDVGTTMDFHIEEDWTQAGTRIVEMSTATGSVMVYNDWAPAVASHGLIDLMELHPDVNSTPLVQVTLQSMAQSDLVLSGFGKVRATALLPVEHPGVPFSGWAVGDSVLVTNNGVDSAASGVDPFVPQGLATWLRIVAATITVPSHGVATQRLTLNMVPTSVPQPSGF